MKILSAAALVSIALLTSGCSAGCSTLQKVDHVLTAPSRTTIDEKAVLAAEDAYSATLDTVTQAAKDGRIKGADAARVAEIIRKASLARHALETALHGANAPDLTTKFADFKEITAELAAMGAK